MDPFSAIMALTSLASLGKQGYDYLNQPSNSGTQSNQNNSSGGFFGSNPAKNVQLDRFKPQQSQGLDTLLQRGLSGMENMQSPSQAQGINFDPIRQQARKRYNEETVPSLYERFTSMGSSGQNSSAFQNALAGSASDLETNLAALEAQFGMQNKQLGLQEQGQEFNQLMQMISGGLTPQFENIYQPERGGFGQGLALSGVQGLAAAFPDFIKLFSQWYSPQQQLSPTQQLQKGG